MIPHKSLVKHDPENGKYGDCVRVCLASILDVEKCEDVPHFYEDGSSDHDVVQDRIDDWMKGRGLWLCEIPVKAESPVAALEWIHSIVGDQHYILAGNSRLGAGHFVVCRGAKIVNDPSDNGIVGPQDDGYYWLVVVAKIL